MAFDSLSAFFVMEGHGHYVWTCYGVFFLLMAALVAGSLSRRRFVIDTFRRAYQQQPASADRQTPEQTAGSVTRVKVSQE